MPIAVAVAVATAAAVAVHAHARSHMCVCRRARMLTRARTHGRACVGRACVRAYTPRDASFRNRRSWELRPRLLKMLRACVRACARARVRARARACILQDVAQHTVLAPVNHVQDLVTHMRAHMPVTRVCASPPSNAWAPFVRGHSHFYN